MLFLYSKRLHEQKNITTVNSVTNTWSIQQTPMFHGCTITSHEGKYCTKFLNQYSFICSKFYKLYKYSINISHNKTTGLRNRFNNLNEMYFYQIKCCFYTQNGWMNKQILQRLIPSQIPDRFSKLLCSTAVP
jgi:hypothetical protein